MSENTYRALCVGLLALLIFNLLLLGIHVAEVMP